MSVEVNRREFLAAVVGAALIPIFLPRQVEAEQQYQIVPVEYQRGYGTQSFPWGPYFKEGEEASGLNLYGVCDIHDFIDIKVNGSNSKASQRGVLTRPFLKKVIDEGLRAGQIHPEWGGNCYGAGAACWEAPIIRGSILILGTEISEKYRKLAATLRFGGVDMDPHYPTLDEYTIEDLRTRAINGEAVGVNHSDLPGQEWWGPVIDFEGERWVIRRHLRWDDEHDKQVVKKNPWDLLAGGVYRFDRPAPTLVGNHNLLNHQVVGVMIGTHQLVTAG